MARLNEALLNSSRHVVAAPSLSEADAVVQITEYRHVLNDKGESVDWWHGQFKLLTPAARGAGSAAAAPERFTLLVVGRERREAEAALKLLWRWRGHWAGKQR